MFAHTLNVYPSGERPDTAASPPAYVAAEVCQIRQQALAAAYRQDWMQAADLLARLVERDPDDTDAAQQLVAARSQLRLQDRYAVARMLRQAGEWQATLGALAEIAAVQPGYPDPDELRAWAEGEHQRSIWEPRFGPVYAQVASGRYDEALRLLTRYLAEDAGDQAALRAAVHLVEDSSIPVPASGRVTCGALLARYGDPRPGVCSVPPPMVNLPGGRFGIGQTSTEYNQIIAAERCNSMEEEARNWYKVSVNEKPVAIAAFALARYPVTNAQYALFIEAGGYNPDAPWWDTAGRAWLHPDQRTQPSRWNDARFGYARPNHPVVGVTWYEATAFCCWLTQYLNDGYTYRLPSEAEWEYAARGLARRLYAWGEAEPDGERANFDNIYTGTTAVGCFTNGATPEGILDLAGNVWEWTRSVYRPYPYDPGDGREDAADPAQECFTLRGGGWCDLSITLRASYSDFNSPDYHDFTVGVRLARHLPV